MKPQGIEPEIHVQINRAKSIKIGVRYGKNNDH